jgi:hypothetical protein
LNHEQGLHPPAIIQPAQDNGDQVFADRLTQLMADARSFGRKTIEQKVATGRKLVEAHEEWERRNAEAQAKDRTPWPKLLNRFGFSKETARRLMITARSHDRPKMGLHFPNPQPFNADDIYDDGIEPDVIEGKKPCRDCRMKGKSFNPKCAACRALNRPTPKPKDNGPLKDEDGNPVPEHLVGIFHEGRLLRELGNHVTNAIKAIKGLVERPGCSGLRVDEAQRRLKGVKAYLSKFRPGYVHLECGGNGCQGCNGRGWQTVMEVDFERAKAAAEERKRKGQAWRNRQRASDAPIPE